ncbi:Thioredoxin domain-containing protein 3,Thioredoxin domain-containing protein 3 homolog [Mytilus edulis]|uniref:Thioredoxin domain-containing protein 3,Thioredoxin domain-containing protein 3 homolog n=1 Tax=Mytilus edulis TaxID=6550 RepID=A0A8S3ST25_MYTED|nr:Thioredoxin domain-containing protein 3,Thioredoxin domain-containing protein 3 homolog [Mytilus edulis]
MNAVHGSSSLDMTKRELALFFPDFVAPGVEGNAVKLQTTLALEYQGQEHFDQLIQNMTSGPVLALGLIRENAIREWRNILGPQKFYRAKEEDPYSLQEQFAVDDEINSLHGSDSEESAKKELQLFFPMEETVAVIKPDAMKNKKEIVNRIHAACFRIAATKTTNLSDEVAKKFYSNCEYKDYYNDLIDHMKSGETYFMGLCREGAVEGWRSMIGPSDPTEAKMVSPDSIRATYGESILRNAVHGSSNPEHAKRSIKTIFGDRSCSCTIILRDLGIFNEAVLSIKNVIMENIRTEDIKLIDIEHGSLILHVTIPNWCFMTKDILHERIYTFLDQFFVFASIPCTDEHIFTVDLAESDDFIIDNDLEKADDIDYLTEKTLPVLKLNVNIKDSVFQDDEGSVDVNFNENDENVASNSEDIQDSQLRLAQPNVSEEETNYFKISTLLLGIAPRAVKIKFDDVFPPEHLRDTLSLNIERLTELKITDLSTRYSGTPCFLVQTEYSQNTKFTAYWNEAEAAVIRLSGGKLKGECDKLKIKLYDIADRQKIVHKVQAENLEKETQNQEEDPIPKNIQEKNPTVDLRDKHGYSPLYRASNLGHIDIVKSLLEQNSYIDLCDKNGRSPLYWTSYKGHTDIVKLLLEYYPNVDLCDKNGCSPLACASQTGHTDIVKLLLEKNSNVDLCNKNGRSPMYWAIQEGHTEIVKLLLERNPNVDLCDNYGWSLLYCSSQKGYSDIVKLLLERNPNVDLCDKDGCSPLYCASRKGQTGIVKLLLEKDLMLIYVTRMAGVLCTGQVIKDILIHNDGLSPLHLASMKGHTDILKLLFEKNPNVDLCDKNDRSPLYWASQKGYTDIVQLLLEKNPNVNLCDKDGRSPLYCASLAGHTDILLLEKDPNVDLCSNDGLSPLHLASMTGHTEILKLLFEKNPNVDLCDKNGRSPLYFASQKGHTDIVKLLLENNPNVDLCGNDGCSPLYWASQKGYTDIVKLLLEKIHNVDLCDKDGRSPLYCASLAGHTDIVKLLLEKNLLVIYVSRMAGVLCTGQVIKDILI